MVIYLLIVYDIGVERVNKVHKFLKTYLHWQQNSVFEGEVNDSQFYQITDGLYDLIIPEFDSILIYQFPKKYLTKTVLGIEKNPINFVI